MTASLLASAPSSTPDIGHSHVLHYYLLAEVRAAIRDYRPRICPPLSDIEFDSQKESWGDAQ